MQLPDPRSIQEGFRRRGYVLVADALDDSERAEFFDVAIALVRRFATNVERSENAKDLRYTVVTGDRIEAEGTPLFGFYTAPQMLEWIRTLTDLPTLGTSSHLRSAININCLHRPGQQYPWHRDAVPYTSLLFLSSVPASAGGAFRIRDAAGGEIDVQPTAGTLIFMDGARCEHSVAPITEETLRISVPMVYPVEQLERPAGLDEFLYGS